MWQSHVNDTMLQNSPRYKTHHLLPLSNTFSIVRYAQHNFLTQLSVSFVALHLWYHMVIKSCTLLCCTLGVSLSHCSHEGRRGVTHSKTLQRARVKEKLLPCWKALVLHMKLLKLIQLFKTFNHSDVVPP